MNLKNLSLNYYIISLFFIGMFVLNIIFTETITLTNNIIIGIILLIALVLFFYKNKISIWIMRILLILGLLICLFYAGDFILSVFYSLFLNIARQPKGDYQIAFVFGIAIAYCLFYLFNKSKLKKDGFSYK